MTLPEGMFSKKLRQLILDKRGLQQHLTRRRIAFWAVAVLLTVTGFFLIIACAQSPVCKSYNDLVNSLAGALLGAAVALVASEILSQGEESLTLMASSLGNPLSRHPEDVRPYQRVWIMYHPTRFQRDVGVPDRGFFWIKSRIDLSAPAPGKLLGLMQTNDPRGGQEETTYAVEGTVRDGVITLHVIPLRDGREDFEAVFTFPLMRSALRLAYGTSYHQTYTASADYVHGPAVLCPEDQVHNLMPAFDKLELGRIKDGQSNRHLDNLWWSGHGFKLLPRVLPQFSTTHTKVGNLEGVWLFKYFLVYEADEKGCTQATCIQKSGARFILSPHSALNDECTRPWMAEVRAMHSFCLSGRWWSMRFLDSDRTGKILEPAAADQAEGVTWDSNTTEGCLLINIEPNDQGITGMFSGNPSSTHKMFAVLAAVRLKAHVEGNVEPVASETLGALDKLFDKARDYRHRGYLRPD